MPLIDPFDTIPPTISFDCLCKLARTLGAYLAEFRIERVKPDMRFGRWLDYWKALKSYGWDVTVLIDHADKTAIAMASRIVRA